MKLKKRRANLGSSSRVLMRTFSTWRGLRRCEMKGVLKEDFQLRFERTISMRMETKASSRSGRLQRDLEGEIKDELGLKRERERRRKRFIDGFFLSYFR